MCNQVDGPVKASIAAPFVGGDSVARPLQCCPRLCTQPCGAQRSCPFRCAALHGCTRRLQCRVPSPLGWCPDVRSQRRVWVRPSVLSLMLLPIVLGRVLLPRLLFPAAREGEVVERSPALSTAWSLRAWSPCRTCLRCATRPLPHSNGPRCEVQPGMESAALFGRAAVYVLVGGAAARDHDGDAVSTA